MGADEADRLRERQDESDRLATVAPGFQGVGSRGLLCQTTTAPSGGSYPTSAGKFFWVQALDVFGAEVEGGAGTTTASGEKFLALHYGATAPAVSAKVWVDWVSFRFVFDY